MKVVTKPQIRRQLHKAEYYLFLQYIGNYVFNLCLVMAILVAILTPEHIWALLVALILIMLQMLWGILTHYRYVILRKRYMQDYQSYITKPMFDIGRPLLAAIAILDKQKLLDEQQLVRLSQLLREVNSVTTYEYSKHVRARLHPVMNLMTNLYYLHELGEADYREVLIASRNALLIFEASAYKDNLESLRWIVGLILGEK